MLLLHAKPYYPAPFYIILLVFGAIQWEVWLEKKFKWVLGFLVVTMVVSALPLLPLSLPYLNMKSMLTFSSDWQERGLKAPFVWEDGKVHELPQDYADMTGWKQVAEKTAQAFESLSDQDQKHAAIYGENYAKTGAINYYNRRNKAMPEAFCLEGSFMYWSPISLENTQVIIYVDEEPDSIIKAWFADITLFETIEDPYFRENGTKIYICKNPKPGYVDAYAKLRAAIIEPNHRKPFEHSKQ
jgi:hypothetical protein